MKTPLEWKVQKGPRINRKFLQETALETKDEEIFPEKNNREEKANTELDYWRCIYEIPAKRNRKCPIEMDTATTHEIEGKKIL